MLGNLIRRNVKKLQNLPNTRLGRTLDVVHLLRGYAPLAPLYVELALTYRCNLTCGYCYQAASKRAAFPDMTLTDVRAIDANLRRSFAIRPRLYLFGGEPTLAREFGEILSYLDRRGYRLSFTTNGTLLERHLARVGACRHIDNVVVSLNAGNLRTVPALVPELVRRTAGARTTVSLNCPVDLAAETGLRLVELIGSVDGCGARFISVQHSQSVFLHGRSADAADLVAQIREAAAGRTRTELTFFPAIRDADLPAYYADPGFPRRARGCVLPWFDLFVQPNGDVVPCDELDLVMGNLKTDELSDIWNSERYRRFRRRIGAQGVSHPICRRCCHRRYY